jgi:hypothetical protein
MSIYQITAICEEHATAADAVVERVFGNTESEVLKNEPSNSIFATVNQVKNIFVCKSRKKNHSI